MKPGGAEEQSYMSFYHLYDFACEVSDRQMFVRQVSIQVSDCWEGATSTGPSGNKGRDRRMDGWMDA